MVTQRPKENFASVESRLTWNWQVSHVKNSANFSHVTSIESHVPLVERKRSFVPRWNPGKQEWTGVKMAEVTPRGFCPCALPESELGPRYWQRIATRGITADRVSLFTAGFVARLAVTNVHLGVDAEEAAYQQKQQRRQRRRQQRPQQQR